MSGRRALWLPGTDHAGIATQMLVERQLATEGTSRQKLGRAKGLGHVVIAARAQAANALIDIAQRAEHEHRRAHARFAKPLHQCQSVQLRQHAVERDDIVVAGQCSLQALAAAADGVDLMTMDLQLGDDLAGGHRIVFNGQNPGHAAQIGSRHRAAAPPSSLAVGLQR